MSSPVEVDWIVGILQRPLKLTVKEGTHGIHTTQRDVVLATQDVIHIFVIFHIHKQKESVSNTLRNK